jgi:hypothetical protein
MKLKTLEKEFGTDGMKENPRKRSKRGPLAETTGSPSPPFT